MPSPNILKELWRFVRKLFVRSHEKGSNFFIGNQASTPKIVLVSHDAHLDGAPLLILHVAQILRHDLSFDVATILLGDGPLRTDFEALGPVIDFTRPDWRAPPSNAALQSRSSQLRALRASGYRYALCNTTVSGLLVPQLQESGFKTLVLVHELPQLLSQLKLTEAAARTALADHVVFPASFVKHRFKQVATVEDSKAIVRPQGLYRINTYRGKKVLARNRVAGLLNLTVDTPIVIGAGPADRRKGIDIFCQVASLVVREVPNVKFVWIGDDNKELARECKIWLEVMGVSNSVLFRGLIKDPGDYAAHIAAADIFLMTSREDPFPSVVLDAMAVGVPVVGFQDAGGFTDLLSQGAGILVPYEDRVAMANATLSLIQQPSEGVALGKAGQKIIDARFNFRDYVQDLVCLVGAFRPSVSVVIVNSRSSHHLSKRITSVVQQTYRPHEILIDGACETADSSATAERLLSASGIPFRIIQSPEDRRRSPNWRRAVNLCSGDLLWAVDAADDCEPSLLERLVPSFCSSAIVLAYCQSKEIDEFGNVVASDLLDDTNALSRDKWLGTYIRSGIDEIMDSLAIGNTIPSRSAVLMRRSALENTLDKNDIEGKTTDWLTYTKLLECGSIYFCPETLNSSLISGRDFAQGDDAVQTFIEILSVQEYISTRYPLSDYTRSKIEDMRQRTFANLGLKSEVMPHYWLHPAAAEVLKQAGSRQEGSFGRVERAEDESVG